MLPTQNPINGRIDSSQLLFNNNFGVPSYSTRNTDPFYIPKYNFNYVAFRLMSHRNEIPSIIFNKL